MESAFRRWDRGKANLLKLIVCASGTAVKLSTPPPYLALSILLSGLDYWESPAMWLATLANVMPDADEVGKEVIRGLASSLGLDMTELGAEAQAALDYPKSGTTLSQIVEHTIATPDWSKLQSSSVNPNLIAAGILHASPYIGFVATNAIWSGFAKVEAAELIPEALESSSEHTIWCAAALVETCLGDDAFPFVIARLERPITVHHKCLFREVARLGRGKYRESAIKCFFTSLDTDDPGLATGIAEQLDKFSPPLDGEYVNDLRNVLSHWTKRGTTCREHGTIVKGSSCPQCNVVPPSPRAAILKELNRLAAVSIEELIELCRDPRHDVSDFAKECVLENAAKDTETFSNLLDQIVAERLSPRILDKLLKLPIQQNCPIAQKTESLLHASDLQLRLTILGQVTGDWIDRKHAIKYLRAGLVDEEPAIRTLATRTLRLIEAT